MIGVVRSLREQVLLLSMHRLLATQHRLTPVGITVIVWDAHFAELFNRLEIWSCAIIERHVIFDSVLVDPIDILLRSDLAPSSLEHLFLLLWDGVELIVLLCDLACSLQVWIVRVMNINLEGRVYHIASLHHSFYMTRKVINLYFIR